jgi:transcriptional regulator GlxA family with amidase domain
MKFLVLALNAASLLANCAFATPFLASRDESICTPPDAIPDFTGADFRNVGVVMFNGLDMVDVYGTLNPLYMLAHTEQQLKLYLIAETLENVTPGGSMNPYNSSFYPEFVVTNTFDDDLDIDLLIVPGGSGVRANDTSATEAYLQKMFPRVKVFMTICTGSGLAAKSGVLDGHMATTNKKAWGQMTGFGPHVKWVSPARYVVDGKVWSSSGVSWNAPAHSVSFSEEDFLVDNFCF